MDSKRLEYIPARMDGTHAAVFVSDLEELGGDMFLGGNVYLLRLLDFANTVIGSGEKQHIVSRKGITQNRTGITENHQGHSVTVLDPRRMVGYRRLLPWTSVDRVRRGQDPDCAWVLGVGTSSVSGGQKVSESGSGAATAVSKSTSLCNSHLRNNAPNADSKSFRF